jgi:hypothetical protein
MRIQPPGSIRRRVTLIMLACALTAAGTGCFLVCVRAEPLLQSEGSTSKEVTITAPRVFDPKTLNDVIVPRFVEAHAALSPVIDQIGRWHDPVCPSTSGLQPAYNEFVSRRMLEIAKSVAAPVKADAKCTVNVEVVFTPAPQELLDHLAKDYPHVLGYYKASQFKQVIRVTRPVQAWYRTVTRAMSGSTLPIISANVYGPALDAPNKIDNPALLEAPATINNAQVDSERGSGTGSVAPGGNAQGRLGSDLRSEFLHVLVVVDARAVAGHSLRAISDYVAVLALTRLDTLDTCSELPSIVDLFSSACGSRAKPDSISPADIAFLRALYASDLVQKLSLERAQMRSEMTAALGVR